MSNNPYVRSPVRPGTAMQRSAQPSNQPAEVSGLIGGCGPGYGGGFEQFGGGSGGPATGLSRWGQSQGLTVDQAASQLAAGGATRDNMMAFAQAIRNQSQQDALCPLPMPTGVLRMPLGFDDALLPASGATVSYTTILAASYQLCRVVWPSVVGDKVRFKILVNNLQIQNANNSLWHSQPFTEVAVNFCDIDAAPAPAGTPITIQASNISGADILNIAPMLFGWVLRCTS